jgi:type VI secretion system protein
MRMLLLRATTLAACLTLVSCILPKGSRYTLHVNVAPDANQHTPVPVDLVFVWDKAEATKVGSLTSAAWFASKTQVVPDPKKVTVCAWEWVPGQVVSDIHLAIPPALRRWPQGVFVFANYRTEGPHSSRVAPGSAVSLDLGRDALKITTIGDAAAPESSPLDEARACRAGS